MKSDFDIAIVDRVKELRSSGSAVAVLVLQDVMSDLSEANFSRLIRTSRDLVRNGIDGVVFWTPPIDVNVILPNPELTVNRLDSPGQRAIMATGEYTQNRLADVLARIRGDRPLTTVAFCATDDDWNRIEGLEDIPQLQGRRTVWVVKEGVRSDTLAVQSDLMLRGDDELLAAFGSLNDALPSVSAQQTPDGPMDG